MNKLIFVLAILLITSQALQLRTHQGRLDRKAEKKSQRAIYKFDSNNDALLNATQFQEYLVDHDNFHLADIQKELSFELVDKNADEQVDQEQLKGFLVNYWSKHHYGEDPYSTEEISTVIMNKFDNDTDNQLNETELQGLKEFIINKTNEQEEIEHHRSANINGDVNTTDNNETNGNNETNETNETSDSNETSRTALIQQEVEFAHQILDKYDEDKDGKINLHQLENFVEDQKNKYSSESDSESQSQSQSEEKDKHHYGHHDNDEFDNGYQGHGHRGHGRHHGHGWHRGFGNGFNGFNDGFGSSSFGDDWGFGSF